MYYTRQIIEADPDDLNEDGTPKDPQVITTEHKVAFGDTLRLFDANNGAPGNVTIELYAMLDAAHRL